MRLPVVEDEPRLLRNLAKACARRAMPWTRRRTSRLFAGAVSTSTAPQHEIKELGSTKIEVDWDANKKLP